MPLLDTKGFGTIEQLSKVFGAYENWPGTAIESFSKTDILTAVNKGELESRSFQDQAVKAELDQLLHNLNNSGISHAEKDKQLAEWARKFHIRRVAFLYKYFPEHPIRVTPDLSKVEDGIHRIMAAIVLGRNSIEYVPIDAK
jgi:hypothetical protein